MQCPKCSTTTTDAVTSYILPVDNSTVFVTDVPCQRCPDCGLEIYSEEIREELQSLDLHSEHLTHEILVIEYQGLSQYQESKLVALPSYP